MTNESLPANSAPSASNNNGQIEHILKQMWGLQVQQTVMLNSIRAGVTVVAVIVAIEFVLRLIGVMR
jgi:hypothetical protein